jgi:hypothetical protein
MLITPAFAQAAGAGDTNSMLMSLLPFALIFVIMYFLILRPQQKKVKDHAELVKNIRVRNLRRRARAANAPDDLRRARQGRAGEGKS